MTGNARTRTTSADQRLALASLALLGWDLEPALDDLATGFRTARRITLGLDDLGGPLKHCPQPERYWKTTGASDRIRSGRSSSRRRRATEV